MTKQKKQKKQEIEINVDLKSLSTFVLPEKEPEMKDPKVVKQCPLCSTTLKSLNKKHCRLCGEVYCRDCTAMKVNYPKSFNHTRPERICQTCLPGLLLSRNRVNSSSVPNIIKRKSAHSLPNLLKNNNNNNYHHHENSNENSNNNNNDALSELDLTEDKNTFESHGAGKLSLNIKFMDKVSKAVLWYAGVGGSNFDRKTIAKLSARKMKKEDVCKIEEFTIEVPYSYDTPYLDEYLEKQSSKLVAEGDDNGSDNDSGSGSRSGSGNVNGSDSDDHSHNSNQKEEIKIGNNEDNIIIIENEEKEKEKEEKEEKEDPDHFDLRMKVYYPEEPDPNNLLPVLLWYHGGAFILGDPNDSVIDRTVRVMCNRCKIVIVSVAYRLAPEFKFPTQVEDSYSALCWVREHGEKKLNVDVSRIAVGGDSAGGNLAAVVCLMSKDRNGPEICHQLLVYPAVQGADMQSESHITFSKGPILSKSLILWAKDQYLTNDAFIYHPYVSPFLAEDFSGLPPATIIAAYFDPLRDHAEQYANKLKSFGVLSTFTLYKNSPHGFFYMDNQEGKEAVLEACACIQFYFKIAKSD